LSRTAVVGENEAQTGRTLMGRASILIFSSKKGTLGVAKTASKTNANSTLETWAGTSQSGSRVG
jgi:hypothetical protein